MKRSALVVVIVITLAVLLEFTNNSLVDSLSASRLEDFSVYLTLGLVDRGIIFFIEEFRGYSSLSLLL